MSTKELHSIIEASFHYTKYMHQQSNPTQDTTIPPPQTILAALSHPSNSHTHATTFTPMQQHIEETSHSLRTKMNLTHTLLLMTLVLLSVTQMVAHLLSITICTMHH